ncbi:hypothetical protein [Rhizobium sp.]
MANKPASAMPQQTDREETYDEWFLRQVDEALVEADSPDAVWVPHEEVQAEAARRREEILGRLKKTV